MENGILIHKLTRGDHLSYDDIKLITESLEQVEKAKQAQRYEKALRMIDGHIRSTKEPIPHIAETLKAVLPEYKEINEPIYSKY